ncbi:MAG: hypothetical protein R3E32_13200 [Chitinophagales bacterium]
MINFGQPGFRTVLGFQEYEVETNEKGTLWQIMLDDNDTWNYFTSENTPNLKRIGLASQGAMHNGGAVEEGSLHFEFGYYLAANNNEDNFIKVNSYIPEDGDTTKPKMFNLVSDLYNTSNDRKPKKGDILFNSDPNPGEYSGWICVRDYVVNPVPPDTREEWMPFGLIES